MADRLLATAPHYLRRPTRGARHHIDRALAQLAAPAEQPQIVRVRFAMRTSTHYFQARILWLQGFAEQALRIVADNIKEGNVIGHAYHFTMWSTIADEPGSAATATTAPSGNSPAKTLSRRDLLGWVYARFNEGFATADLTGAKNLLAQLVWGCRQLLQGSLDDTP
jgi:hypothetical protein